MHNEGVIAAMGMAWDTGAPMWPYQTPGVVLVLLNAPAYLVGVPFAAALGLRTLQENILIRLTAILILWYGVGFLVDHDVVQRRWHRNRRILVCVAGASAAAVVCIGVLIVVEGVNWWTSYGQFSLSSVLVLGRALGALPWCALASFGLIRNVQHNLKSDA